MINESEMPLTDSIRIKKMIGEINVKIRALKT